MKRGQIKKSLIWLSRRLLAVAIVLSTMFGWRIFTSRGDAGPKDAKLPDRLVRHVLKISAEIGDRDIYYYEGLKKCAEYIKQELDSFGYPLEIQQYEIEGKQVENIIAVKRGSKFPEAVVIVGAHYDSCFNPGADDNASGVAGLLELARSLKDKDTEMTVKFIAFTCEEPPFFKTENMGSRRYARKAKASGEDIRAVIALDAIGYYSNKLFSQRYLPLMGFFFPAKGNFIAVLGDWRSRALALRIKDSFKRSTSFPVELLALDHVPCADFSDHWSFWKEGYPGVMLTDTAFLRHENYHKATDTWEKLDYAGMACVVEGLNAAIVELSKAK